MVDMAVGSHGRDCKCKGRGGVGGLEKAACVISGAIGATSQSNAGVEMLGMAAAIDDAEFNLVDFLSTPGSLNVRRGRRS